MPGRYVAGAKQIPPSLSFSPKNGGVPAGASGGPTPQVEGRRGQPCGRTDAGKEPVLARRGPATGQHKEGHTGVPWTFSSFVLHTPASSNSSQSSFGNPTFPLQSMGSLQAHGPRPQPISTLATLPPLGGPGPSHQWLDESQDSGHMRDEASPYQRANIVATARPEPAYVRAGPEDTGSGEGPNTTTPHLFIT